MEPGGGADALEQCGLGRGHPHLPAAFEADEQRGAPGRVEVRGDLVEQQDRWRTAALLTRCAGRGPPRRSAFCSPWALVGGTCLAAKLTARSCRAGTARPRPHAWPAFPRSSRVGLFVLLRAQERAQGTRPRRGGRAKERVTSPPRTTIRSRARHCASTRRASRDRPRPDPSNLVRARSAARSGGMVGVGGLDSHRQPVGSGALAAYRNRRSIAGVSQRR